jgi:membrane associated rhomboid family serine protease/Tfp pilus assembly protein PilF
MEQGLEPKPAGEMSNCICCGDDLPASAEPGEVCPACESSMEQDVQPTPAEGLPHPSAQFPITKTLVAINLCVFVLMAIVRQYWPQSRDVEWGADWGPLTLGGQWWRLLTSTFIHVDGAHLLVNLFTLWILGKRAEQIFGRWIFLLFYLSCGLAGSIASLAIHPELVSCGASAGIFGLAGGLISVYGLKGLTLTKGARWKLVLLILWTAWNVYPDASTQRINNAAHAGGLISGLIVGALLSSAFAGTTQRRRWVFSGMAAVLLLAAISVHHYRQGYVIPLGNAIRAIHEGRTDDGLRELHVALQKKPDSMLANLMAARVYLDRRDYPNAEAAARRALAVDHDDDLAIYLLGITELQTGRCKEAQELVLERIYGINEIERYGKTTTLLTLKCNKVAEGDRYLRENQLDQAIDAYKKALQSEPGSYQAQIGLGNAFQAKGMPKEAAAAFAGAKAAQMRPEAHR